jgi:hypothetical protein
MSEDTEHPTTPDAVTEQEKGRCSLALGSAINVIFDGPPGPESGRFVEVETDNGHSINAGEWIERPDGLWALRITRLPNNKVSSGDEPR